MSDERWTLEKVIEETRQGMEKLALHGDFPEPDQDFSYLTQELLDSYWNDSKEKNEDLVESEVSAMENVACYWGNRWAHISATKWAYTNNHSGDGCDPVTTGTLCGSGHRWTVRVRTLSGRYCANGVANPKMAWR
jgi:hypothetical protein